MLAFLPPTSRLSYRHQTNIKLFPTPCQHHFNTSRPSNHHRPLIVPTSNRFPHLVNAISTPPAHQTDIKPFPTPCQRHLDASRPSNRHQPISHSLSTPFQHLPLTKLTSNLFPQLVNAFPVHPALHRCFPTACQYYSDTSRLSSLTSYASHSLSSPFPDSPPVIPTSNAFPQLVNTIPMPPAHSARHQTPPAACSTPSRHTRLSFFIPFTPIVLPCSQCHSLSLLIIRSIIDISLLLFPRIHRFLPLPPYLLVVFHPVCSQCPPTPPMSFAIAGRHSLRNVLRIP